MARVYRQAKIMALCSCNEGGPRLTADAMACEVPDDHDDGRCHARDHPRRKLDATDDLALGIRQILEDPALAQRLSAAGCESVHSRTWDQRTGAILEFVHLRGTPIQRFPLSPRRVRRCLVTESPVRLGVLNIGFSRYRLPLDPHQKKKFESLSEMAELHVVRPRSRPKFCTNSCERHYMPT